MGEEKPERGSPEKTLLGGGGGGGGGLIVKI